MVDQTNPTEQFHPYQPATSTPVSERSSSGLGGMLRKVGIGDDVIDRFSGMFSGTNMRGGIDKMKSNLSDVNLKGSVTKARDYARTNPGKVLGGLAIAVIGAGLIAKRSRSFSR